MIIQCQSSCIVMQPVRQLLLALNFVPADCQERVGMAFVFPLDRQYDNALDQLSLMERVPEMQMLGITSQWRVNRWLSWLAKGVVRQLGNQTLTFTHYAAADEPTRIFINVLAEQMAEGALIVLPGGATVLDDFVMPLSAIEQRLAEFLAISGDQLTSEQLAWLTSAGELCAIRANYWQAQAIYEKLKDAGYALGHQGLGLVHRFYGNFLAAEYCFEKAREQYCNDNNVLGYIKSSYAQALLHLRFHVMADRSLSVAAVCIATSYEWLKKASLASPENEYAHMLIDAAEGLYQYRQDNLTEALALCEAIFRQLMLLSGSDRRQYVYVFTLTNKARVLRALARHDEAVLLFKEAATLDPKMSFWWIEWVQSLLDLGHHQQAIEIAKEGLLFHHDCPLLQQLALKAAQLAAADTCGEAAL